MIIINIYCQHKWPTWKSVSLNTVRCTNYCKTRSRWADIHDFLWDWIDWQIKLNSVNWNISFLNAHEFLSIHQMKSMFRSTFFLRVLKWIVFIVIFSPKRDENCMQAKSRAETYESYFSYRIVPMTTNIVPEIVYSCGISIPTET